MSSILIVAKEIETARKLQSFLSASGFTCLTSTIKDRVIDRILREGPELVIVEMDGSPSQMLLQEMATGSRVRRKVLIMALMTQETLNRPNDYLAVDDFIVWPYDNKELDARVKRLVQRNLTQDEIIKCGDLEINLANCEVRVEGKIVELTFKEFELLKFLAQDTGRVYTREALLNKVWGYDYFGGDRTVDVHVRRLRGKIELSGQTFIETVRNIGYRFKKVK
jgi:two-component system, OmpR family, alkaline phosphatase synthesis response regulator PhoP